VTSTDPMACGTLYSDPRGHAYLNRVPFDRHHRHIVATMIGVAGVTPGDTVVEIGAGSGRYTGMLLRAGLRVIATEPDVRFIPALESRLAGTGNGAVLQVGMDAHALDRLAAFRPRAVMGFHVLHHLDRAALHALDGWLSGAAASSVPGAAFLEPNPWNPLYAVQIALHPAMKFREERGLWSRYCGPGSACPSLRERCNVGLLPPGLLMRIPRLPIGSLRSPLWAPWSAYRLIGRSGDR
jgi:hypothetical protein